PSVSIGLTDVLTDGPVVVTIKHRSGGLRGSPDRCMDGYRHPPAGIGKRPSLTDGWMVRSVHTLFWFLGEKEIDMYTSETAGKCCGDIAGIVKAIARNLNPDDAAGQERLADELPYLPPETMEPYEPVRRKRPGS